MKVLVTGGTGYIGSHTVIELLAAGHEVEILDNLYNSKLSVLDQIEKISGIRPVFHQVDLLNTEKLNEIFQNHHFDAVLHFAGLKAVAESVAQPLKYYETNIGGTLNLLNAMRKYGASHLIFSSSATVYGVQNTPCYTETMSTGQNLADPYGRTKYMIEEIIKDTVGATPGFQAVILRYFNPIGAHESGLIGEDPNGEPNNLMPIVTRVHQGKIKDLSVFGDDYDTPDGTCIRDYIHVVDLTKGHIAALASFNGTPESFTKIYNLGRGQGVSVYEMIKTFSTVSGKPLPYYIAPRRAGDLAEFYADPTLAGRELGWKAEKSLADAMRDTLNFLAHQ